MKPSNKHQLQLIMDQLKQHAHENRVTFSQKNTENKQKNLLNRCHDGATDENPVISIAEANKKREHFENTINYTHRSICFRSEQILLIL
jgi:hypothetical protein